jgi:endogenous inhibitor of DNA gyrase (YacG/DUF329 family)
MTRSRPHEQHVTGEPRFVIARGSRGPLGLEWVVLDGRRTEVSGFAHLPPGARPRVTCPECGAPVTLKLGKVRRHHAAHAVGSTCAATQPETALHLNVKYFLAAVLERAAGGSAGLLIRRRCAVGNRPYEGGAGASWVESTSPACAVVDDAEWVSGWDDVAVESRLTAAGAYRTPDIVLRRNGSAVAAIEILASHAVDAEKAAMLARLEVPWIEVRAVEQLYEAPTAWTIDQPLEPVRGSMPLDWRCELHEIAAGMEHARAARVFERPAERAALAAARLVDVYRPGGAWQRLAYRVRGIFADGRLVRLALDRNGELLESYPALRGESEEALRARVGTLIRRDCARDLDLLSRRAAVVDAGRWVRDDEASRLLERAPRVRRRYRFNPESRAWERDARGPSPAADAREHIEVAKPGTRSTVQHSLAGPDE